MSSIRDIDTFIDPPGYENFSFVLGSLESPDTKTMKLGRVLSMIRGTHIHKKISREWVSL